MVGYNILPRHANYEQDTRTIHISLDREEMHRLQRQNFVAQQHLWRSFICELCNVINGDITPPPRVGDFPMLGKVDYAEAMERHEFQGVTFGQEARTYGIKNLGWDQQLFNAPKNWEEYLQEVTTPLEMVNWPDGESFPGEMMSHYRNYEVHYVHSVYETFHKVFNDFMENGKNISEGILLFREFCEKNKDDLAATAFIPGLSPCNWVVKMQTLNHYMTHRFPEKKIFSSNKDSCDSNPP